MIGLHTFLAFCKALSLSFFFVEAHFTIERLRKDSRIFYTVTTVFIGALEDLYRKGKTKGLLHLQYLVHLLHPPNCDCICWYSIDMNRKYSRYLRNALWNRQERACTHRRFMIRRTKKNVINTSMPIFINSLRVHSRV
jgi:hypothetical protein